MCSKTEHIWSFHFYSENKNLADLQKIQGKNIRLALFTVIGDTGFYFWEICIDLPILSKPQVV